MEGSELDFFLSVGYFRMQQGIFTCQYVTFDAKTYPVYWLRIVLATVSYGPKQTRLLRINSQFSATVKPFALTDELESFYSVYRKSINFDAPDSVKSCLFEGAIVNAFDTQLIEIRDGDKLIAAGIYDNGYRSIAGIMNFYHPDYHRQSLGKYLMLLKTNYARQQQKDYYYPGYLVGNYPKFDYKLFPCQAATELFDDNTDQWYPFSWEAVAALSASRLSEY